MTRFPAVAPRRCGLALRIEYLSLLSGRTVSYPVRFETNRHDVTSCSGSPSCHYDRSSLRIEYLALPSGRSVMTRCPALGSPSRRLYLRILYLALPSRSDDRHVRHERITR